MLSLPHFLSLFSATSSDISPFFVPCKYLSKSWNFNSADYKSKNEWLLYLFTHTCLLSD